MKYNKLLYSISLLFLFITGIISVSAQSTKFDTGNVEYYIQNKKIGLRDCTTKKIVVACKYDFIGSHSAYTMLAPFKRNEHWGYIDDRGVEKIAPKYEDAKSFSKEELAPVKLNGKWGFITKTGVTKISFKYEEATTFYNGYSIIKMNGKCGAIDPSGKIIIPCKYDELSGFDNNNTASASLDGKYGLINNSGQVLVDFRYQQALYFNKDGLARCKRDDKEGIVNREGKEVVPCTYEYVSNPYEGLIRVKNQSKYGFLDYGGNVIIPLIYEDADDFENGITSVEDEEGCYIISSDTRRLASFREKSIITTRLNYCKKDLFVVKTLNDEYEWNCGLANKDGKFVIPKIYQGISIFGADDVELLGVQKNGKWGFSDYQGNVKISCLYDDIGYHFQNGHIACKKGNKWGIIDPNGNILVPFTYDLIDQNGSFSRTKNGDKWGAISSEAKVLFEPKYDEVGYPRTYLKYFPAKLDGKDGYVDYYGNDTF